MKWNKKGLIFCAAGQYEWMRSHTQVPTPLLLDDRLRVFFATRSADGISHASFVDLDLEEPSRVLYLHDQPILDLGEAGMFDEHGIIPSHVFRHEGQTVMFYVGWSRQETVGYSNWTGMAVSDDNGTTFRKSFDGPVLDRTRFEPYSATGLVCLSDHQHWHGWYATGTQWLLINGRYEHTYEIRYCRSDNLLDWTRPNEQILPTRLPNESNTRPTIVESQGRWHMWFCYRGTEDFRDGQDSYQIGYAWSDNLHSWTREDDQAGISKSSEGWDSTMIAYPYVIKVGERFLMFYCGNGFGRTGFGYAELEGQPGGS
jgi:hypothetical protein